MNGMEQSFALPKHACTLFEYHESDKVTYSNTLYIFITITDQAQACETDNSE